MRAVPVEAFPVRAGGFRATVDVAGRPGGELCLTSPARGGYTDRRGRQWPPERPILYDSFLAPRGEYLHHATDITCAEGAPVVSPVDGQVPADTWVYRGERCSRVGFSTTGGGHYAWIKDTQGNLHYFSHLSEAVVRPGQKVRAGQLIGRCGHSGNASCPHLHYAIESPRGEKLNPFPLLRELYLADDWKKRPYVPRKWLWWSLGGLALASGVTGLVIWLRK